MDQAATIWDHCLQHTALSDVGLRRANNQDAMAVVIAGSQELWQRRGHLFVVADGMGAHAAGELASKLATDTIALAYSKRLDLPPAEALFEATRQANQHIHDCGQADPDFRGMGTTSTALLLLPEGAVLAHVGDSRAYRLRDGCLEQLTFDHSLIWEMRSAGQIAEDKIPDYIPRNIITRSLGPSTIVDIDLEGPFPIEPGDTFLLCSDGLSGPVKDGEIGAILHCMPPDESARALVNLANLRGGPDNISVIVVRVVGPLLARTQGAGPRSPAVASTDGSGNPLVWTIPGVCGLGAVGAAVTQRWILALICLIGAVAAGIAGWTRRSGESPTITSPPGKPLGKGPYVSITCPADGKFVQQLADMVQDLCDAAIREDWVVDWPQLNAFRQKAAAAREAAADSGGVQEYFRAIDFVMGQLKRQRRNGNPPGRTEG
ncbi:MAG: serine/threonine-protein phosphatase [Pirellulales bacterium]|nr:serine/threonine-protein phosphatase [Pirellulales bacterium]